MVPSTLMMRYRLRVESKKKLTLTAWLLAGIQDRFVFGSMWNTCAFVEKMGCSLKPTTQFHQLAPLVWCYNGGGYILNTRPLSFNGNSRLTKENAPLIFKHVLIYATVWIQRDQSQRPQFSNSLPWYGTTTGVATF